jgi:hypothetical protein
MSELFPTLDRPMKATSGLASSGKSIHREALLRKIAVGALLLCFSLFGLDILGFSDEVFISFIQLYKADKVYCPDFPTTLRKHKSNSNKKTNWKPIQAVITLCCINSSITS